MDLAEEEGEWLRRGVGIGVLISLGVTLNHHYNRYADPSHHDRFNRELCISKARKLAGNASTQTNSCARDRMVKDIIENVIKRGDQRTSVLDHLGAPDQDSDEDCIHYYLENCWGHVFEEPLFRICFNSQYLMTRAYTFTW